mmetsp:Transcript_24569/g.43107  ORF Transcript_24569/g.43107 Transcript_24569/m.43107 type:complete len:359 (+) Transcript_24569:334-1410(+)
METHHPHRLSKEDNVRFSHHNDVHLYDCCTFYAGSDNDSDRVKVTTVNTPTLDLRKIYASTQAPKARSKSWSVSSFTTERSTASTTRTSNTTQSHTNKKQQKRRFLLFTKILMKLLERKDPVVYNDAQAVIHDCEQKKRNGETDSVLESMRSPLKDVVGPEYWNEARSYSMKVIHSHSSTTRQTLGISAEQKQHHQPILFNQEEISMLQHGLHNTSSPVAATSTSKPKHSAGTREDGIRKKRLWMVICVFMKYLMRIDGELYVKAKGLVSDCVSRHRRGETGYHSLSGSIQSTLKKEIGMFHWRRAENYVAKVLLANTRNEEHSECDEAFAEVSAPRKRWSGGESLQGSKKCKHASQA